MSNEGLQAIFAKVDTDKNKETMNAAGVNCFPTFKFYKNGSCIETLEGANEDKIR
jgi:thioredoxin 1